MSAPAGSCIRWAPTARTRSSPAPCSVCGRSSPDAMTASAALPAGTVPARDFRRALGRFATGVTLVTAPGGEALVVSAFMSVSLEPPLVAFSVGRSSLTWRRMRRSPRLGINVLPQVLDDVHDRARPGSDRLADLDVLAGPDGVPRLSDAVAFLHCEPVHEHDAGDHA